MNNDYNAIYGQFEKNFKEEASSFITEESIQNTLAMEKIRFDNASKCNIPINTITGNSLARYTKDRLRQCQPLFSVYYILSMLSELSYYLLIWSIVKCTYFYFTGFKKAFSVKLSFSVSLVFFIVIIIYSAVTKSYARNQLFKCSNNSIQNVKSKIYVFNTICGFISAVIVIVPALFVYLNLGRFPAASLSLFEVFIFTVAMLSVSGVHNVIYSSHFTSFITTGYLYMLRRIPERNSAISHYRELSLTSFLSLRRLTVTEYKESVHLQLEFNQWLRHKIITFRVYGALALFITAILAAICIRQLIITGPSTGLIIFTAAALVVTALMLLEIISCNCILKTCVTKPQKS